MRFSPSCSLAPHPLVSAAPGYTALSFCPLADKSLQHVRQGIPAGVAMRERRLLLAFVALAHVAGAMALTRLDATTEPILDMPITVALIQPASTRPDTFTEPEPPAAVEAPPVVQAPPEPPSPLPAPLEPPPPPPVATPEPPRPRLQPAPRKNEVRQTPQAEPRTLPEPQPAVDTPAPVAAPSEPVAAPTRPQPTPAPTAATRSSPAPAAPVTAARFDAAYLNNPPPLYPRVSRRMREEGRVLLRVFVTSDGTPGRIELSESSGSSRLDQAAEAAVASWRFVPARQGKRAIDAWVIVPIVFRLEG